LEKEIFMTKLKNRKVLVLNKGWNAIGVVSLERALVMLFSPCRDEHGRVMKDTNGKEIPKARIIDPTNSFQDLTWEDWGKIRPKNGEDTIKGINTVFRIPEVILLSRYDKMPQHKIHFSRRTIYRRDGNTCQYCGCQPGTEELTIDHIVPRSCGGKTTWENCILACIGCNSKKADIMPDRTTLLERREDKEVHVPAFIVYFNDPEKGGKTKKTIKQPKKPIIPLFKGDIRIKSWEAFLGEAYWLTELQNDN
jgi:hypothetical protein